MGSPLERRQTWSRIIGVERRSAPIQELDGHPLPDPTLLEDEDFPSTRHRQTLERERLAEEPWYDPTRFD